MPSHLCPFARTWSTRASLNLEKSKGKRLSGISVALARLPPSRILMKQPGAIYEDVQLRHDINAPDSQCVHPCSALCRNGVPPTRAARARSSLG